MRRDESIESVEAATRQLDQELAELQRLARDSDETGKKHSANSQKSAIQGLLRTQAELEAGVPDSLKVLVEIAYKEPNQGDPDATEAREDARQWLVTNEILSQQELLSLTHSQAVVLVQERTGIQF